MATQQSSSGSATTGAAAILGVVIGAVAGFYGHALTTPSINVTPATSAPMGRPGGGSSPGGGGGGFGGGGHAGSPSGDIIISRIIGGMSILQQVQGKGLTAEQKKVILPILKQIKTEGKVSKADGDRWAETIQRTLPKEQFNAIFVIRDANIMGRRGQPENPFSNAQSAKDLDTLIALLEKP